jgi:hypothetical protein
MPEAPALPLAPLCCCRCSPVITPRLKGAATEVVALRRGHPAAADGAPGIVGRNPVLVGRPQGRPNGSAIDQRILSPPARGDDARAIAAPGRGTAGKACPTDTAVGARRMIVGV